MQKKQLWLIMLLVFISYSRLFTNEITPELKSRIKQFAIKQKLGYEDDRFIITKLPSIVGKGVERYLVNRVQTHTGVKKKAYLTGLILIYKDTFYKFPNDYNNLIRDMGIKLNENNIFEKVEELIKLWTTVDVNIESIKWENLSDSGKKKKNATSCDKYWGGYVYNIEAISYSAKYNIRMKWNIGFHNGKLAEIKSVPVSFPIDSIFRESLIMRNIYTSVNERDAYPDSGIEVTDYIKGENLSYANLNYGETEPISLGESYLSDKSYISNRKSLSYIPITFSA